MQHLHGLGWGTRRIAAEVGCDRDTVQRHLAGVPGPRIGFRPSPACWQGTQRGWLSGCGVIEATRMSCATS